MNLFSAALKRVLDRSASDDSDIQRADEGEQDAKEQDEDKDQTSMDLDEENSFSLNDADNALFEDSQGGNPQVFISPKKPLEFFSLNLILPKLLFSPV